VDFDALRAAVVPGAGVVGRWPGVVCVAECADRNVLRKLIDVCATASGHEPGRALARRLAMWLGGPDAPGDGLRFGTVAVTAGDARAGGQRGEQWAVFLYGPVGLVVPDRQVALSGAQSVAWTDRLLPRPDAPVVLALEGGPIPPGLVDGVHDLRAGVVPGAGAVLVPNGDPGAVDVGDEAARTRPADSRWLDAGGAERQWAPEAAPTASGEGLYPGDATGNGLPSRSLGPLESFQPGDQGGAERSSGRPHLRPVPSGSNGVAHRGWVPRRGSVSDLGRAPDTDHGPAAGPRDRDPAVIDRPGEIREPEVEKPSDNGRNGARSGGGILNGAAYENGAAHENGAPYENGAAYDLLGAPEAPPQEGERSPWSDGRDRDASRPERIEGWFGASEGGTETGLNAIGPAERRRRRHRLPDEDALAAEGSAATPEAPAGDRGEAADERGSDDFAPAGLGADPAGFGSGSVDETRIGSIPPIAAKPATSRGDEGSQDDSGDGTPRLGVPAQEAPQIHPLADPEPDGETPRTTALRSERIMGAAPEGPDREDAPATGGLAVDRQEEPGPRPPIGLLVFDDGATYTVDAEYLMGRMPEADPRVASGELRSLALEDSSGAVSRVHAQIVVNGWEALLVDVGSRNGTFVSPPGEQGWTQLPAGETHRLVPGTRVRIGGRSFQFEAPSGTR
jgi:hypothetical protein